MPRAELLPYLSPKDWDWDATGAATGETRAMLDKYAEQLALVQNQVNGENNQQIRAERVERLTSCYLLRDCGYKPWARFVIAPQHVNGDVACVDAAFAALDERGKRIVAGRVLGAPATPAGRLRLQPDYKLYDREACGYLFNGSVNDSLDSIPDRISEARAKYGISFTFDAVNWFVLCRLLPSVVATEDPFWKWIQDGAPAVAPRAPQPGGVEDGEIDDDGEPDPMTEKAWSGDGTNGVMPLELKVACLLHHEESRRWKKLHERFGVLTSYVYSVPDTTWLKCALNTRNWEIFEMCLHSVDHFVVALHQSMIRENRPQVGNVGRIYSELRRNIDWSVWESKFMKDALRNAAEGEGGGFLAAQADLVHNGVNALDEAKAVIGNYLERELRPRRNSRSIAYRNNMTNFKYKKYWTWLASAAIQHYGA